MNVTMEHSIPRIDKLQGASNWPQWRFQMCNVLRAQFHDGRNALGVITSTVVPPTPPPNDAGAEVLFVESNSEYFAE